eukprot:TRINITY_DN37489_c0_g1_i1.p1 TRINITY_DN37489_c0_g1~~TRINITY_DN37489_c0_g1_i1.p1  ORF type:complete len:646 (-),score=79.36 TRINITY_DN37489_c0_g1_i1:102-2039(-)
MPSTPKHYTRLLLDQDNEDEDSHGKPIQFFPPPTYELDVFLFKELMHRLEAFGYTEKISRNHEKVTAVHRAVFRRFTTRLLDTIELGFQYDPKVFEDAQDTKSMYLTWYDIQYGIRNKAVPAVDLNAAERIMMILEDGTGRSILGSIWQSLSISAIILSVVLIIARSLPEVCPPVHKGLPAIGCLAEYELGLVLFFSFEYFTKLLCSPFIRVALTDSETNLSVVVPDPQDYDSTASLQVMSGPKKIWQFMTRMMNIVDFVAILPFWLQLTIGNLIPFPLVFLRALRLLRLFRVVKIGKFDTTLAVLGTTLIKSVNSAQVLLVYMLMASILVGAAIQQLDPENEAFRTVPTAFWWVFARLDNVQHSVPEAAGRPTTLLVGVIVCIVKAYQKFIWILPLALIKVNFSQAWKYQTGLTSRRREVLEELQNESKQSEGEGENRWIYEGKSASARLELYAVTGGQEVESATGSFPLPIRETASKSTKFTVPLHVYHGGVCATKDPGVSLEVQWTPTSQEGTGMSNKPRGSLKIILKKADNLAQSADSWRCKIYAFTCLHHEECWTSPDSVGSNPLVADWDAECSFAVDWAEANDKNTVKTENIVRKSGKAVKQMEQSKELLFKLQEQKKQIEEQNKRLEALQKALAAQKS